MKKTKQNIDLSENRYGLFMNDNSFNLDIMYGRHFLETDNIQEVTVYRINIVETKTHKLYGQSKPEDKKYLSPIKIKVVLNVETGEQKLYGDNPGGLVRDDTGNLNFSVYLDELKEKNLDINRGDIIKYNMSGEKDRFYEVEYANNVTDITNNTIGGFKPYFRKIIAVPVKSDVTDLIK